MCKGEHWLYGDIRHYNRNPHTEKWTIYDPEIGVETDVDENTIGQFTGLCDKNGKEIYEGDIVKSKGGWGGVVTWNSRGYYYVKDKYYFDDEEPDLSPLGSLHCFEKKQLEIVGNIHDNPEFMEEARNERDNI